MHLKNYTSNLLPSLIESYVMIADVFMSLAIPLLKFCSAGKLEWKPPVSFCLTFLLLNDAVCA